MRALLVTPRLPGTGYTGDRLRAELHLAGLRAAGFDVVLVGGLPRGAPLPRISGLAGLHPVPLRPRVREFARLLFAGAPLQAGLVAGDWASALRRAGNGFQVVVCLLVRIWPYVRGAFPGTRLVLDYVDSLGAGARQASRSDPAAWRRLYWALDAARLERAEREAGELAVHRFCTTPKDAALLPGSPEAVPNGVPILPLDTSGRRGPLVAFPGRLGYRPNELAAMRLAREIWPRVRREVPSAVLVLGGADAPPSVRSLQARDGIVVESPVPEMPRFLRKAMVVALPLDLGTGTPNKLFEAFEAGVAVVASEEIVARAESGGARPPARVAGTDEEFSRAIVGYLKNPESARVDGLAGREFVAIHADRRTAVETLAARYREMTVRS